MLPFDRVPALKSTVQRGQALERTDFFLKVHLDLFCCGLLVPILLLLIFVFPDALLPLRSVFGFIFLLLTPGYLTAAVLFPGQQDIDGVERLALSVGLSVIAVPLVGLLLNYTPWGINLYSMSLGMTGLTVLMLVAALGQRQRLAPAARFYSIRSSRAFKKNLLLLGLVVLAGVGIVVTAQTLRPSRAVTEFYLLNLRGRPEDPPSELRPNQAFTVTLGVHHFGQRESYTIRMPFLGRSSDIILPQLGNGEAWQQTLTLRAPSGTGQQILSFDLYQNGRRDPYRTLQHHVSLGVSPHTNMTMCPGGQLC